MIDRVHTLKRHEFCSMLMYEYVEYKIRHRRNPMNDGGGILHTQPMWREQFDHASKDFLSHLGDLSHDYMLHGLRNMDDELTQVQKWWHVFGRYWLIINRHNDDDDVKLMTWLMNRAAHGTVNVCGENVNYCFDEGKSKHVGTRLIIDNNSKLLCKELGQQIPIKSRQKLNRDVVKFMTNTFGEKCSASNVHRDCWKWQNSDHVEPNTRNGFFFILASFSVFFIADPSPSTLTVYRNAEDNANVEDVYGDLNGYRTKCASISGELMTFFVGGPRYFQNNGLLENSPLWTVLNPTNDIHNTDIFRDTKYTYGSPLFRQHYEHPSNPSLSNVDEEVAWWDINSREDDCFKDANDYGYVATQLSHLPRLIGYDFGNVIMYRALRGNEEGARFYDLKRSNLSGVNVIRKLINETSELPFNLHNDSVTIVQHVMCFMIQVFIK